MERRRGKKEKNGKGGEKKGKAEKRKGGGKMGRKGPNMGIEPATFCSIVSSHSLRVEWHSRPDCGSACDHSTNEFKHITHKFFILAPILWELHAYHRLL